MKNFNSHLRIRGLELCLHLGWPENERSTEQVVLLDVDISYATPPNACETDKLEDTYCYADLTTAIREHLAGIRIHLIEHLAHEIHKTIKSRLHDSAKITVHITKHPKIRGLTKGVTFSYGDH